MPAGVSAGPDIDRTLELLREHDRRDRLSKKAIGRHLFETYFGGNEALVRSKDSTKSASFNALRRRARAETSWSGWDLQSAILLYLVSRTLRPEVAEAIKPTYLVLLDTVEGKARSELADRLASGALRGNAARKAIFEAGGQRRGGRIPKPRALLAARELERLGKRVAGEGVFRVEALRQVAADDVLADVVAKLVGHAERIQEFAAAAQAALAERNGGATGGTRRGRGKG